MPRSPPGSGGDIDAAYVWSPAKAKMLEDGGEILSTYQKLDAAGYVIADLIVAKKSFAEAYPEALTGLLAAYGKALACSGRRSPRTRPRSSPTRPASAPRSRPHDMKEYDFVPLKKQLSADWLGEPGKPGKFATVLKSTADFLVEQKSIRKAPDLERLREGHRHDLPREGRRHLTGMADPAFIAIDGLSVSYPSSDGVIRALERVDLAFAARGLHLHRRPFGLRQDHAPADLGGLRCAHHRRRQRRRPGRHRPRPRPRRRLPAAGPVPLDDGRPECRASARWFATWRKPEREASVERLLGIVGLWEFRNRYPYELSGGMQQRLAIARALVNDPKLLLMDEPFGALDALTREKMQEELHAVWRRAGMTIVFITHSVEEAVYLGTNVVVMSPRPGRVVEHIELDFARRENDDIRAIKASPAFVEAREHVLGLIWRMAA